MPSTSPGSQRPAQVSASVSATRSAAIRVPGGRLGHGDDVVARAAAGSCTASAARPCTTDAVGTTTHVLARRGARRPPPARPRRQRRRRRAGAATCARAGCRRAPRRARPRRRRRASPGGVAPSTSAPASRASLPTSGADDDHEHGPLADEPARRGLVGEPDHGDPVRPARGDPGLDRGADVVAVHVDVPAGRRPSPTTADASPSSASARAQARRPRVARRVEQVHHLVVVLRRAGLAPGGQRGRGPRDARARRRRGRPVGDQRGEGVEERGRAHAARVDHPGAAQLGQLGGGGAQRGCRGVRRRRRRRVQPVRSRGLRRPSAPRRRAR